MKTLAEVKTALAAQKSIWLASTTIWSDFDADFDAGNRKHRESVEFDFLTENDAVDSFDPENSDDIGVAMELRSECLHETLRAMCLT